jgi:peptidyl-prolyl cis-trans isomerase B (cyclophilin B)
VRLRRGSAAGLAVAALALTAAACGSSSSSGGSQPKSSINAFGCTTPAKVKPQTQHFTKEPKLTIARTTYTARIVTNCGTIIASLDGKAAPHTVNSFAFLASKGFFTDTPCGRLTTAQAGISVLQCDDPTGDPGYTIPDENLTSLTAGANGYATYPPGTLAMANTGQPHTGGSQFFLVYANSMLMPQYTPFGKVVDGMSVLNNIARAGTSTPPDGQPKQPVVIESFTVTKGSVT